MTHQPSSSYDNLQPDHLIGKQLGAYRIVEAIGQSSVARIYKGRHAELNRDAAIKLITWGIAENEVLSNRFRQEVQAVAALRHPNLITIYDFGKHECGYYLVMEYINGPDLETYIGRGDRLLPAQIQWIVSQVAEGLDYAHAHGVVHKKIKPSNIILTIDRRAILTNFGLARLSANLGSATLGDVFSTLYYTAPEQAVSPEKATVAGDIYSLGVVLFELIADTPPYVAGSPLDVASKHVNEPVPDVRVFAPDTPAAVSRVIQKAMAKDPAERFSSAVEMAECLSQAWGGRDDGKTKSSVPVSASGVLTGLAAEPRTEVLTRGVPGLPLKVTPASRKRMRFIWGMAAMLVLLALSVGVWRFLRQPDVAIVEATLVAVQPAVATPTVTSPPTLSPTPTMVEVIFTSVPEIGVEATATSQPLPTATATFTSLPSPTFTQSPTVTGTATPVEETPVPTNTPTTEELLKSMQGKILFKTNRNGRVEIYQMNPDGSGQTVLEPERAYLYNEAVRWESFSPDRQETIVVRGEGQLDLWRVNVAGGTESRITSDAAADYDSVWSPDGGRIIFVSERTGNGDLYILDLNEGGKTRLTLNEGEFDKHPSWSPDGKWVVFWSNQGDANAWQIWSLNLETGQTVPLSNNSFKDWDPVWVK